MIISYFKNQSLAQISQDMSTKELLAFLKAKNVDVSGVVEKSDLLNIARKMSTV